MSPAGNLENRILWMEFYEARQGFGGVSPEATIWTLIQFLFN